MTLADDGKLCKDCRERGLKRPAHRILLVGKAGKRPVCDEDYRIRQGLPQLTQKAEALVRSWQRAQR